MARLGLRLRVFLFFGLIALGGTGVVLAALWLGFRQLGDPGALSAFATVAIVAAFGLFALALFVWRLFDEHVAKPIETMAAQFRLRANEGASAAPNGAMARYLGDLAPAARDLHARLRAATQARDETIAQHTARLERHCAQLVQILSDLPVAVIVARSDHQIVLYDGQAAALMEREAPARLGGSVQDYLDAADLETALAQLAQSGDARQAVSLRGASGAVYAGHLRRFGAASGYTLMLEPLAPDAARPLVHDLDLLEKSTIGDLETADIGDLSFVVFDSETTGLNPARDAVVQLGAVRVVNGRIIHAETFETLVDPGQPIPASSSKVHGITDAMVAGAQPFAPACAALRGFARDAVIVAHNAPFDMAFLHRNAQAGGVRFDNPVLDTVHLSAIVFGGSAEHTLDAICDRLGIEIDAAHRHTALGDALATAQAFVAMLPILQARGFGRFGDLRAEIRKHARILKVQE